VVQRGVERRPVGGGLDHDGRHQHHPRAVGLERIAQRAGLGRRARDHHDLAGQRPLGLDAFRSHSALSFPM
jgi:hypothetical protein